MVAPVDCKCGCMRTFFARSNFANCCCHVRKVCWRCGAVLGTPVAHRDAGRAGFSVNALPVLIPYEKLREALSRSRFGGPTQGVLF